MKYPLNYCNSIQLYLIMYKLSALIFTYKQTNVDFSECVLIKYKQLSELMIKMQTIYFRNAQIK